jgi:sulfite reductase (NADPH) flavoprotein alpha-component
MAVDVDRTLHEIVVKHGSKSADDATAYMTDLKRKNRYVCDVY